MAGFRSLARQVRDPRCDLALRRYSLRKCLERFAPYGHRATWDHLCSRHGFGPEDRSPDPARLVAALAELEEARALWLAHEERFAARRRREKHDGLRRPAGVDTWQRRTGSGYALAWCDNPVLHPSLPLAEVLRRLLDALDREPGTGCPVCATAHLAWGEGPEPHCVRCGISVPRELLTPRALAQVATPLLAA
ncbi:hypothetical protein G3M53_12955 [Streptomyces sp. SID7982]|nr:hypothetical protein [Streptomyces sp. SID7982]